MTLRRPPPLEQPLHVERADASLRLMDGDLLIAEGGPSDLRLEVPDPVPLDVARRASQHSAWAERHPFPGCFGCGPERSQDEAVAIIMGEAEHSELFAGTWTPLEEFAGDAGVRTRFAWAALDCPTAVGANLPQDGVSVLGRLSGRIVAPIEPGVTHTVVAWPIGDDGRKHLGGTAIHAPNGRLCACSAGLWIELRDPSTMGART